MRVKCTFVKDKLLGDNSNEICVELVEILKDRYEDD